MASTLPIMLVGQLITPLVRLISWSWILTDRIIALWLSIPASRDLEITRRTIINDQGVSSICFSPGQRDIGLLTLLIGYVFECRRCVFFNDVLQDRLYDTSKLS